MNKKHYSPKNIIMRTTVLWHYRQTCYCLYLLSCGCLWNDYQCELDASLFQLTRPFTHLEIRRSGAYVSWKGSCHKLFSGTNGHSLGRRGWGEGERGKLQKKSSAQRIRYLLHLGLSNGILLEMGCGACTGLIWLRIRSGGGHL